MGMWTQDIFFLKNTLHWIFEFVAWAKTKDTHFSSPESLFHFLSWPNGYSIQALSGERYTHTSPETSVSLSLRLAWRLHKGLVRQQSQDGTIPWKIMQHKQNIFMFMEQNEWMGCSNEEKTATRHSTWHISMMQTHCHIEYCLKSSKWNTFWGNLFQCLDDSW